MSIVYFMKEITPESLSKIYQALGITLQGKVAVKISTAKPEMKNLEIFASLDPVALDQARYDAAKNAHDPGKKTLIERMDSRHAIHTVESAEKLGLGERAYRIVSLAQ